MWTRLRISGSFILGCLVLLAGVPGYGNPRVRPVAQDQPQGAVSSLGFVSDVLTDRPFYLGGEVAKVDVTIRNDLLGFPINGLLELHVLPDDDPLGGGGEEEGTPIYSGTRVVQRPPGTGTMEVVERFYVPLPTTTMLYHAMARWRPADAIDFNAPVATGFGVRPNIPGVPEDILTFNEVTVNVPAVRAALKAGPPLLAGGCNPANPTASTQSSLGTAGRKRSEPATVGTQQDDDNRSGVRRRYHPATDGKVDQAGSSPLSPGENANCGWEMRLPPDPVVLPIDASH